MNLIIVSKFFKTPKKIALRVPRALALLGAFLIGLFGFGASAGYLVRAANDAALTELQQLRDQVEIQQDDLDATRGEAQREINAMAVKLAELQAQSTRLNALGERLTRIGALDDGEFNFGEPPAVGGPASGEESAAVMENLQSSLDQLGERLGSQARQLQLLESMLLDRDVDASLLPSGRPVSAGYMSSSYGNRADPFTGFSDFHQGVDFNGPRGSDVLSVADGVVSFSGRRSGYGNVVEIDHSNGYMTRYGHNLENLVKPGERIRAGQLIAKMGATGRATGNHVHFEVWLNNRAVNPHQYLRNARG
jgi:murein DD-endopeptidase MepM/ murein hydrolase activator NlpD